MNIKYYKVNESELSSLPFNEGSVYFCKDTGKLYADPIGGSGSHILINDNINDDIINGLSTWSSTKIDSKINDKGNELTKDYNDKIKMAAPVNLLDNSDFTNPVNQRGQNSYAGDYVYTIDRWQIITNISAFIDKSGLRIKNNDSGSFGIFAQPLQSLSNGYYTLVVNTDIGKYTMIYEFTGSGIDYPALDLGNYWYANINSESGSAAAYIRIFGNGSSEITVKDIALYKGKYTEDVSPDYKPKGYYAELLECQRYYIRWNANERLGLAAGNGKDGIGYAFIPKMRIIPTINFKNVCSTVLTITSMVVVNMAPNVIGFSIRSQEDFVSNAIYDIYPGDNGYCEFIADL